MAILFEQVSVEVSANKAVTRGLPCRKDRRSHIPDQELAAGFALCRGQRSDERKVRFIIRMIQVSPGRCFLCRSQLLGSLDLPQIPGLGPTVASW